METIVTGDTPGLPDMEISRINSSLQRILIVEDNDDLRNYLVDMLRTGYNIQSCPNGKEALIIIREFNPDLVISDIMMPEMEEEDLNATLETYGGTLQLVFGEDGAVTMVQGGGNAEGTYEYSDDNTAIKMTLDFGGTEVTYAGFLSEVGDTVTLIAMSDMNGYDGLYFVQ